MPANSPVKVYYDGISRSGTLVSNDGVSSYDPNPPARCYLDNVRSYTSTPNYKDLISSGIDASAYYLRRHTIFARPSFHLTEHGGPPWAPWVFRTSDVTMTARPDITDYPFNGAALRYDDSLSDIAVKRLKSRIGGRTKQVQLLIPLAESRELKGLASAILSSGFDLVKALVEIKRTKGKSALRFAADKWLTWSFALAPTISEATAIKDAIATLMAENDELRYRDRGSSSQKKWYDRIVEQDTLQYGTYQIVYTIERSLSYQLVAGYTVRASTDVDYARDLFGLSNPFALVPMFWELTAFSWVADYFGTIGDVLEDLFIVDPVDTRYVSMCRRYEHKVFVEATKPTGPWVATSSVEGSRQLSGTFFEIERTPLSKIPQRQLRFKTQAEIGNNAVSKLLNLASLLVPRR